ncbi:DUF3455 domain-containing protein [Streptomyces apricus]|uniref:DUF3455 domain-containing protein n=1 Tax=Streptomyces apricus TaxID=1828112 RepID=A0A5B0B1K5_9ACTN|nr:DUF3455 domain-containing protein [Streptomyces apricus]KAA0935376.1 DUF3455 domain-containing protein [Streptomyces apricus]
MKSAKRLALTTTALAAVTVGTLTGVSAAQSESAQSTQSASSAQSSRGLRVGAEVPDVLKVPDGNRLTGVYSASGVQTYTCTDGAWKLLEPAATLWARKDPSRRSVALHSRGPVWVSTVDGSAVNAAAVATSPKTGTIPELLLQATSTRGTGVFADVSYIQRLGTAGGVAPTTACTGTDQVSVPYSATYTFYKPAK